MDGLPERVAKVNHRVGWTAIHAEPTKKLVERNANHVADKRVKKESIQLVGQHLLLVEHLKKARAGVKNLERLTKTCHYQKI